VTSDQRHALVRITREAVINAVRHGEAERIWVALSATDDVRMLTVRDDGSGFEVPNDGREGRGAVSTGYGLTSMEERARGLPGTLTLWSAPGKGTEVTVWW